MMFFIVIFLYDAAKSVFIVISIVKIVVIDYWIHCLGMVLYETATASLPFDQVVDEKEVCITFLYFYDKIVVSQSRYN